ncbi:MAG: hypothetical protein R3B72_43110 [Polyangiaceae bacterium]
MHRLAKLALFASTALAGGLLAPACGSEEGCGECFAAVECVESCDGAVVQSGCCPCPEGSFDRASCSGGDGGGGSGEGGSMNCPSAPNCLNNEIANDSDQDGCPDRCCVKTCGTDMMLVDDDADGCNDTCADKPCSMADDCAQFLCSFDVDTCGAPVGLCSDLACETLPGGCGCDGNTYATACDAAAAGVGIDTTGAACSG